jgi:LDH2 family malate/lactate/ureidoglycolate dehydrogenase
VGCLWGEDQPERGGGQVVQAIDVEHFQPLAEFLGRMDRMVDNLKSSKRREGVDEIFVPGELEFRRKERYLKEGIPLDQPTRDSLKKDAEIAGTPYDIEL